MFKTKRIYETPAEQDGYRVLVDRIWPRGLSKEAAAIDQWAKEVAPRTALRRYFGHDAAKWDEFYTRYAGELDRKAEELTALKRRAATGTVTLLYGAKDTAHNNAVALKRYLERS